MLLIVGTVRLPPENLEAARSIMIAMAQATRAEHGCVQYDFAEDVIDRGLIHLTERWIDRAALAAHFTAPHIAEWRAAWPALGIGDRSFFLYEVGEPEPT
jgi:quinol monooxygenase YgiN